MRRLGKWYVGVEQSKSRVEQEKCQCGTSQEQFLVDSSPKSVASYQRSLW